MNDIPETTYLPITDVMAENINNLCEVVNDWAGKKGWNEGEDSISHKAEQIALMHSELSECLEALRHTGIEPCPNCVSNLTEYRGLDLDLGPTWICSMCQKPFTGRLPNQVPFPDDKVPNLSGEEAELADVLIRIFHYCGKRDIDLGRAVQLKHEYNTGRPYRHGKKI